MKQHTLLIQVSIEELERLIEQAVQKALTQQGGLSERKYSAKMDLDELCARYKLKKSSVYSKTSDEEIPYIKTGKNLLFDEDDIEAWLETKKRGWRKSA